jgi:hypothetical protein
VGFFVAGGRPVAAAVMSRWKYFVRRAALAEPGKGSILTA